MFLPPLTRCPAGALLAALFLTIPARALPPVDAVVVFNEIHYHPADAAEAGEFIELHNQMGVDIDLSGWRLAGGVDYRIPDGTVIPGNGWLVVARTPAGIPGALGPWTGALSNGGETLRLRDRNDRLMDEISYGDSGEWPVAADGSGVSLAKRDADAASPLAANWSISQTTGGTPGGDNFPPPPPETTTRVIPLRDTWRYDNTGTAPAGDWTLPGFSDAAWSEGAGVFNFGGTSVYDAPDPDAPPPDGNLEIGPVTILARSSEATGSGLRRAAVNCVNGSGLTSGAHDVIADDNMWLTNGTSLSPTDPLPAEITFAFPAAHNLTKIHVWNYNENRTSNLTTRGAKNVEIFTASTAAGPFASAGTFVFPQADGTTAYAGVDIPVTATGAQVVRFVISSNWGAPGSFTGLSEVKFYSDESGPPPAPPVHRETIPGFAATGTLTDGRLASPGSTDLHYIDMATGFGAKVQTGHPAWMGADGLSQWTGVTANGTDNVPPGALTYRLTADLTNWRKDSVLLKLYAAADNNLDAVKINGTTLPGVSGAGFSVWLGPFTVSPAALAEGMNTVDFLWSNAGTGDNPGGFRARWEASAEPDLTGTVLAANPVTTRFRKRFTWSGNPASSYRLRLEHVLDDAAAVYLNGTEIYRTNLPAGALTPATPALTDVAWPQFSGLIEVPAAALVQGENVVAVELHQAAAGLADALFGLSLDVSETPPAPGAAPALTFSEVAGAGAPAGGFFVELVNGSSAALDLAGWVLRSSSGASAELSGYVAAGGLVALTESALAFRPLDGEKLFLLAPGGTAVTDGLVVQTRGRARTGTGEWAVPASATPGTANAFSIPDSIVINEILYAHMPVYQPTGTVADPEEWVELYNRSGSAVDLTGWRLRGGADFDFAPGTTLAPGGYLVVARHAAALAAKFPAATITGDWSGSLSGKGDTVRIEDGNGNTVDEVHYLTGGSWDSRADGGGSSLELRHPDMDNSLPGAWEASDETAKAEWQTFSWSGPATPPGGSNDPTNYNEFVLGLLSEGVFLLDDVSVKDNTAAGVELIQDGSFAAGNAAKWRLLGNHGGHGRSGILTEGGNSVLRITATGPTEHMHNHCETTLKNGTSFVAINPAHTYTISFRAKWQSGSPRLNGRLYFNRLNRQVLLPVPAANGTPGAPNSRLVSAPAPGLTALQHLPVLPGASEPVTVRVQAAAAVSPSAVSLYWRKDPATSWSAVPMTPGPDRYFEATLPGQAAGTLVQFYVKAETGSGAATYLPAAGPDSRAMIRWADGVVPPGPGHGFRILLPQADTDFLHLVTNVMSNDYMPCTVIYRESEVFYDAGVRLKSSQRGRYGDPRVGFAIQFDPAHLFRGVHSGVNMDRSAYGQGTTGSGFGQVDIINQQFAYRAGGIPAMYNDMVYLITPRSTHTGSAQMTMAEFNDVYLDSQWDGGAGTPTFKLDLVYFPLSTTGGPEGLKNAQPDDVKGVNIGQLTGSGKTADRAKEDFRWNFIIGNARSDDDYTSLMAFNHAFSRLAVGDASEIESAIDVDQWLRASAAMSLVNSNDSYSTGGLPHNLKLYVRPDDGRVLYLPWDADFSKMATNFAAAGNSDLVRILNARPAWRRAFYGHLHDIISSSYNVAYLTPWVNHFSRYSTAGGDWNEILTYVQQRSAFILSDCAAKYPQVGFSITTNNGQNFSSSEALVTVDGRGWINVREIRLAGSPEPLNVTWVNGNTWRVTLPVRSGPNAFTLEAIDYQGAVIGADTLTITGTGSVVAAGAGNLVISELHYHPADPTAAEIAAGFTEADDFEYVELQNISSATVDLSGCRFTAGLTYAFANGLTLAPGGRLVIPRRTAAFLLRAPGVAAAAEYYEATGNVLSNGGEEIALTDASGADIQRFTWADKSPWPAAADGDGPSLVLVNPLTDPDHTDPANWRASAAPGGTPGGTDALPPPADPLADDDGDGVNNLLAWATGGRPDISLSPGAISVIRNPLAEALWSLESSPDLTAWSAVEPLDISRDPQSGTREELRYTLPVTALPRTYYRWRVRLP